ncbi:hypothetical protein [Streptomyces sp. NPDC093109]|uniref:hypothetical protein n=1 Tax=Streptomyces sp. NPDC093109 TaxID=3154977 RepID=UPI00344FA0C4
MPAYRSERANNAPSTHAATPATEDRQRRLAHLLAEMMPSAAVIRVSHSEPGRTWPSPYIRAYDKNGDPIEINRARATIAARWIIRSYPDADWDEPQDLDLATATLAPTVAAYAAAGRGR